MNETCHEEGMITETVGNRVKVTVERGDSCGACHIKNACHVLGGQHKDFNLILENRVGARVGDQVRLSISESAVVSASSVLYLVPALGLIIGAVLGAVIAKPAGLETDPSAIVGCFIGLGFGLSISFGLGRKLSEKRSFLPRISSVTRPNEELIEQRYKAQ